MLGGEGVRVNYLWCDGCECEGAILGGSGAHRGNVTLLHV